MTDRLQEIFSRLPNCQTFADIGCDHGYIAKAMLDSGKCQKAIVSDISAKCLSKAEQLLAKYIDIGKAVSVVSDGFEKVDDCDCALIAGMGGEEIVAILNNCKSLPNALVLQPMKNVDKVRQTVIQKGYKIITDYVFSSGRIFYDLIVLEKGKDALTEEEIEFGRTNLLDRGVAFTRLIENRINVLQACVDNPKTSVLVATEKKKEIQRLKKYV